MSDLIPTELLSLPRIPDSGPINQEPAPEVDPFETALHDLYLLHREDQRKLQELERLYELALAEIKVLESTLADLRKGVGMHVVIAGKQIPLHVEEVPSSNGHKSELADSFIL